MNDTSKDSTDTFLVWQEVMSRKVLFTGIVAAFVGGLLAYVLIRWALVAAPPATTAVWALTGSLIVVLLIALGTNFWGTRREVLDAQPGLPELQSGTTPAREIDAIESGPSDVKACADEIDMLPRLRALAKDSTDTSEVP